MELTIPHYAEKGDKEFNDSSLAVRRREIIGGEWCMDENVKVLHFGDESITLGISHFTTYGIYKESVIIKSQLYLDMRFLLLC